MIERIFIRPPNGEQQVEQQRVQISAGAGIRGDRYFGARDEPGQNVSFIEAEEIEAFFARHERAVVLSSSGRNFITRGVRLNELVGKTFLVGGLRFRGVELCEPCLGFGATLSTATLTPPEVVKQWVHRGGLRADALSSGELGFTPTFGVIQAS
jgi:MOSC domain-containing protein YiiM